jgi:cytochrome c peroxidase
MRGQPGTNEIANAPDELMAWSLVMARLVGTQNGTAGGVAAYRALFQAAYPNVTSFDSFNIGHAARAIAAFEAQSFAAFQTPLDRYLAGDATALSDSAKRGGIAFAGRARCVACHSGPLLSDLRPHSDAVPQLGPGKQNGDDLGVALVSNNPQDDDKFRTPPLRNVAHTGPFMHDGAFGSLERVLQHYQNPAQSLLSYDGSALPAYLQGTVDRDPTRNQARLASIDRAIGQGLPFGGPDVPDLVAFLQSLTDPRPAPAPPASVPSGLPVPD